MSDAAMPAPAQPDPDILSALGARSIVLVGMMGVGKSTIGRRLAARLQLPFVDADTEIEAAAGMTIPEIFERHGEGTVVRLLGEREPIYGHADLTISSRDVPHDRIVEECLETLRTYLCGPRPI
jgi:shikimate kinase